MKIAISFPGCHRRGGVERVMVESLNFLAGRGHDVHAFASEWDTSALLPEVTRHDVAVRPLIPALMANDFRQRSTALINELKPDVTASFGIAAPPDSVVWMQSVHAAWIDISKKIRSPKERFKQRLNPFHPIVLHAEKVQLAGRKYGRLIALTPQVADDLKNYYSVPAGDIDILPNGFSGSEFNPILRREKRAEMREKLGYSTDAKVLVFVANETERKGLPYLLRAVASLKDSRVKILAVGKFDPAPSRAAAEMLGIANQVQFPGASSQVAQFYAAADIFVLPTQYEAWGLVIVEAMACGLPVLTSRLAGASVAVQEGNTGELLDDPRNEAEIIQKLSALLSGRLATDEEISHSVQAYEWSRILARYEAILTQRARS